MADKRAFRGVMAGLFTVALWGSLPLLRRVAELPPLQVAAIAMAAAAALAGGMALFARDGNASPAATGLAAHWLAGVGGLLGALFFYFLALVRGDPAVVTLVTYTWPLGFVVATDWLAGRRPRAGTLLGAGIAFTGIAPLVAGGGGGEPTPPVAWLAGLASGASWIAFSLFLRRAGALPAAGYARLFARAGVLALALHLLVETTATAALGDWLAAALIGAGPYGIAFMAWGYALRHGPAGLLGTLTYATPVIATAALVAVGWSTPDPRLILAAAGVVGGAMVASGRIPARLPRRRRVPRERVG
jgi:drug/metabolite transporter (DMT)-like permease